MTAITVDHSETGLSRVALQYYESANFKAYITALLQHSIEIEALFQKMALQVDIDIAEGVNLDVIGIIVGRSRIIPLAIPVGFFGFNGQPGVLSYGKEGVVGVGGRFRDETEPAFASTVLADPEYRLLLKAKTIKNHSKGYFNDAIAGLKMLFQTTVSVSSNSAMTMQVAVGRNLNYWEKVVLTQLDLVARPAGVLLQATSFDASNYFGFLGQTNAKSYGSESDPSIGGKFANEF